GRAPEDPITVRGGDSREQLVVTPILPDGRTQDVTRHCTITVSPSELAAVDATGLLTPLVDGSGRIIAHLGEHSATAAVRIEHVAGDVAVNFPNQIVPIFTKLGCNSGGCHGKASGQNGFKLSLLGFEPGEDYTSLVKEARGRRLFPAAPAQSLLLTKAAGMTAHGGGQRIAA